MLNAYEIPLTPEAQIFTVILGGVNYTLTLMWRSVDDIGGWVLDIGDGSNNPLVQGIPLVTGCDLLSQYKYLGFDGSLWVLTDGNATAVPTYPNLGSTSHLYFVTTD
jgi:hypothetical protein